MKRNKHCFTWVISLMLVLFLAAPAIAKVAGVEGTITGAVVESSEGLIIVAEDADYLVSGADLSSLIGKTVKATGLISEDAYGKTIHVTSVFPVVLPGQ